ncbi:MAG: hypothetical protein HRJ53_10320 [Acidobacteria bacterium Pan2503]|uniref:Uncharacterized protein n=1 Tax=Candidatus Acidiferrum panamense TaxID=2741543 RepID=A0A7V8SX59_9BACT|nr:hypothetical protein [Candidatus Acidoferrum panamensis]
MNLQLRFIECHFNEYDIGAQWKRSIRSTLRLIQTEFMRSFGTVRWDYM